MAPQDYGALAALPRLAVGHGRLEVASEDLGVEQALMVTLREFKEQVLAGWPSEKPGAEPVLQAQVFIDSGYMAPVAYAFCREAGERSVRQSGAGRRSSTGSGTTGRRRRGRW